VMNMVLNNPYFVVVSWSKKSFVFFIKNYFKDSTRAQFEERQNDAETKLGELRVELEKLSKNIKEGKNVRSDGEDEENDQQEDENLQETLARVQLEEQIMRVEEIVSLYKVKKTSLLFFIKFLRLGWPAFYGFNRTS
jgi:hypothetical protein